MFSPVHLRWVQDKVSGVEHVTFERFVEEFKLSDRQLATTSYAALVASEEIRTFRRKKLQDTFQDFQAHHADVFWSQRKLQISSEITSNVAAVDLQEAAVTKSQRGYSDQLSSGKIGVQFGPKVVTNDIETERDTAVRQLTPAKSVRKRQLAEIVQRGNEPKQKKNRRQHFQQQEQNEEGLPCHRFFDPSTTVLSELEVEGIDIGKPFKRMQEDAALLVNDVKKTLTLELLPFFLAANHIWDTHCRLPGMSETDHGVIQDALRIPVVRLPDHLVLFCRSLEHDMTSAGYIRSRETKSREQDALLVLFQQASQKLPKRFLPFRDMRNEDTHAHSVVDALLTFVFPAYHHKYELHWANRPSAGSGDRRDGDAYKPDATVLKDGIELGYVEMKSPKEERHQRPYLEDLWALSGLAKDTIDLNLRHARVITSAACVLVFGFQMTLYRLSFQSGIYVWQDVYSSYLPQDQYSIDRIVTCVELLKTFKAMMDELETERHSQTPTKRVEDDEELPALYRPRSTNISPSRRPFFSSAKRMSV